MRIPCVVAVVVVACGGTQPQAASPSVSPGCPNGPFASEVQRVMPPVGVVTKVTLQPPGKINAKLEPGCMVPFRDDHADATARDVGRVVVSLRARGAPKAEPLGRGRLYVGRGTLTLVVRDDAGEELLVVGVDGHKVAMRRKGEKPYRATIDPSEETTLPLPLDALVAAVAGCNDDVRLGVSEDVSVVKARRATHVLWRTRWLDEKAESAVDTSVLCSEQDARLAWRTSAGAIGWSLLVASARSEVSLLVDQLVRTKTVADAPEPKPQLEFDE